MLPRLLLSLPFGFAAACGLITSTLRAQPTLPVVTTAPAPRQFAAGTIAPTTLDLATVFQVPGVVGPIARFHTVFGRFDIELLPSAAPIHVSRFSDYVAALAYDNTFFHRVASFEFGQGPSILQGGGFRAVSNAGVVTSYTAVTKLAPANLEYALPNARGTLAAARTNDPNSATAEWYFNTRDNSTILGPLNDGFGYTVFARVLGTGMSVVDAMATQPLYNLGGVLANMPLRDVTPTQTQLLVPNLVVVNSVRLIPPYPETNDAPALLGFTVTSDAPAVIAAAISAGKTLTITPGSPGFATLTLTARDIRDNLATTTIPVTVLSPDPLVAWRQQNFATLDATGPAADDADPDGDGVANLLEYATGSSPTQAGSSPITPGRAADTLTLAYTRVDDASLVYLVEAADSLAGPWATIARDPDLATGLPRPAGPVLVTDTAPLSTHPTRFLRLRVERAAPLAP
jgi:cyclophilin family peptidyl-prolyl cis-trans isomerase